MFFLLYFNARRLKPTDCECIKENAKEGEHVDVYGKTSETITLPSIKTP